MSGVPAPTFSLRLNNDIGVATFVEMAVVAEGFGFDQIWVSHDLFFRSAPVILAAAAGATSTIGLGTCVLNPYSAHPAEIAMTALTLQELTEGRFLLGLAAGAEDFLAWAGIERAAPLRRTEAAVHAIRALCTGGTPETADPDGRWTSDAVMRIPALPVPIYLGAMSPRMLALTGAVADGALPLLYPPESYSSVRRLIDEGACAAGRAPAALDVAACIWVSVDDDPERARALLARKLAYYGPSFSEFVLHRAGIDPASLAPLRRAMDRGDIDAAVAAVGDDLLSLGIAGTPATIVERCRGLIAAGAGHLSFGPPLGPDPLQAITTLGTEVLPALRVSR